MDSADVGSPNGNGARATVLIIAFTDLSSDPRVYRQIAALNGHFNVIAAGLKDPQVEGVRFVQLNWARKRFLARLAGAVRLACGLHRSHYWSNSNIKFAATQLRNTGASAIIANDIDALPLALQVAGGMPVLFDSHEYWPGRHGGGRLAGLHARYRMALCKSYIPQAAVMTTVSPGIADAYLHDTGKRASIITNAPAYEADLTPTPVSADVIRIVHHGAAIRGRHLELMCDMMDRLDERFTLTFVLTDRDRTYLDELKARAASNARIQFLPPVPMPEISRFLNQFDIGAYILQPGSFNQTYALPNKLFEFIQARLAIAIGPSPEMARIVKEHELGVVAKSFDPALLATDISALTVADIMKFKAHSDAVARRYSAEGNASSLRTMVMDMLEARVAG